MFCNRPCDWNCMRQPTVKRIEVMAPLLNGESSTSAIVFLFASTLDGVLYVQAIQSGSEAVGAALRSDLRVSDRLHSRHSISLIASSVASSWGDSRYSAFTRQITVWRTLDTTWGKASQSTSQSGGDSCQPPWRPESSRTSLLLNCK